MEDQTMKRDQPDIKRRGFLKLAPLAVASAALAARTGASWAQGMPHVDESDAQAQALGYKNDAAKVDRKKFAKYQPGETCASCQLYQGKPKEAWGPCLIFPSKQVNAKGWCSAYVKKA
jgi:hypothetical protein